MKHLTTQFSLDLTEVIDIQPIQFKNKNSSIIKRFEKMSEKYEDILQSPITNAETLMMVKDIGKRFITLDSLKQKFIKSNNDGVSVRKLDKG